MAKSSVKFFWLLASGFPYPAAFWRDIKGAALGWTLTTMSAFKFEEHPHCRYPASAQDASMRLAALRHAEFFICRQGCYYSTMSATELLRQVMALSARDAAPELEWHQISLVAAPEELNPGNPHP